MDSTKFLGVCILIAAFIVASAIVWHANQTNSTGRYHIQSVEIPGFIGNPVRIDTKTGEVKTKDGVVLIPANQ